MTVGAISAFVAPEPGSDFAATHKHPGFAATVIAPNQGDGQQAGPLALPILLMVAGFRMPGYLSSAMSMPLFKSLDYSDAEIATVTKLFQFWVALGATFFSAYIIRKIGMMPSLLLGTIAGSASHLSLAWVSESGGGHFGIFAVAVSIEGFAYAFAQVVLINYMSMLTATELAASQFALLTSLCAFPGSILARRIRLHHGENAIHDVFRADFVDRDPGSGAMLVCFAAARRCDARSGAPWSD